MLARDIARVHTRDSIGTDPMQVMYVMPKGLDYVVLPERQWALVIVNFISVAKTYCLYICSNIILDVSVKICIRRD